MRVMALLLLFATSASAGQGLGEQPTYERSAGFTLVLTYGTAGNATGLIEYICTGEPGRQLTHSIWQIRRLTYNSSGDVTNVEWVEGNDHFKSTCTDLASKSYS